MQRRLLRLTLTLLPLLLAGCAPSTRFTSAGTASAALRGNVHGGQQPIANSSITVWSAGTSGYGSGAQSLATTTTDADGNFGFASGAYTCPYNDTPVYITATGGDPGAGENVNAVLAAGLGDCLAAQSSSLIINEVTTAATAFSLGQFFTPTLGYASDDAIGGPTTATGDVYTVGLVNANRNTIPTLVNLASGAPNTTVPGVTVEADKLNSIANSLAACINTTGESSTADTTSPCGVLFNATTPPGGTRPSDTLQAAVQMALYPFQNVADIFNLTSSMAPFVGLPSAPNDWLLAVKYMSSNFGLGIDDNTTSNLDVDTAGRIWFPTNTSTSAGVGYFDPASVSFNGPYAYGGTSHPQNIAIDNAGTVWAADMASWIVSGVNAASPSTTVVAGATTPWQMSAPAIGPDNTLYVSYTYTPTSSPRVATYDPSTLAATDFSVFADPSVALNVSSTGVVMGLTTSGSNSYLEVDATPSGNSAFSAYNNSNTGQLIQTGIGANSDTLVTITGQNKFCTTSGSNNPDGAGGCSAPGDFGLMLPQGAAIDGNGYIWVANLGDASVSTFPSTYAADARSGHSQHNNTHGDTMTAPFGLAIDASGNVWISNAGCTSSSCIPGDLVLSELIGAAGPTITPRAAQIFGANFTGTRPRQ